VVRLFNKLVLAVCILCLICLLANAASANTSGVSKVYKDGVLNSKATCSRDHLNNQQFSTTTGYVLENCHVAILYEDNRYTTCGPTANWTWTMLFWAGYRVTAGIKYLATHDAYEETKYWFYNPAGTLLDSGILAAGETWTREISADPATSAQYKTKGHKLITSVVPEPASITCLTLGLTGIFVQNRRRLPLRKTKTY
jgi:hypothetical protein